MKKSNRQKSCYTNSRMYRGSFGLLYLGSYTEPMTLVQRREDVVLKHWMQ